MRSTNTNWHWHWTRPHSMPRRGLANIYMRGRRFPDAEAALRKVVAAHPEEAAARIQLGRVLAAESKNDDAIAELEAGQKLTPNDMTLQRDWSSLRNRRQGR